jgi:hypothetical protein
MPTPWQQLNPKLWLSLARCDEKGSFFPDLGAGPSKTTQPMVGTFRETLIFTMGPVDSA